MRLKQPRPSASGSPIKTGEGLDNAAIAEQLAREAESAEGHQKLALKRACREAILWPEEAAILKAEGRSLTELDGVGPSIGRRIHRWIEESPNELVPPETRAEFLTMAQARQLLKVHPQWR